MKRYPYPCQTPDRLQKSNQIKLDWAGKLGLGYVEVGFLKRYPYPCPDRQITHTNLNAVVALAPAWNQIKLDWAGKLGLGPG